MLLFIAHSFAFDIKTSLVMGNPIFNKIFNQPQDFSLSLVQKCFLFVRKKIALFLYFASETYIAHLWYTFYQLHGYLSFQYTE
jgi:hypothetical protein